MNTDFDKNILAEEPCFADTEAGDEKKIVAKFNKEYFAFSIDEAIPYVEMGLKWESVKPLHERLQKCAQHSNMNITDFICDLEQQIEQNNRDKSIEAQSTGSLYSANLPDLHRVAFEKSFNKILN